MKKSYATFFYIFKSCVVISKYVNIYLIVLKNVDYYVKDIKSAVIIYLKTAQCVI